MNKKMKKGKALENIEGEGMSFICKTSLVKSRKAFRTNSNNKF